MAALDSDKVRQELKNKLGCREEPAKITTGTYSKKAGKSSPKPRCL
jgi:hypothetical protein